MSTAAIAPRPDNGCITRPRTHANRIASPNDNAPARCAAAISPTLCPITAAGITPCAPSQAATATVTATIAGCATAVSSSEASSDVIAAMRSNPPCSATTGAAASITARAAGKAISATPMPTHAVPCPPQTKTGACA